MATIRLTETALDARQVEGGVREAWKEALADPKTRQWLESRGENADSLAEATIKIDSDDSDDGMGAVLVTITTGVAVNILGQLFKEFIMPKLKDRFGEEADGQVSAEDGGELD